MNDREEPAISSPLRIVPGIQFDPVRLVEAYLQIAECVSITPVARGKSALSCLSLTHRPSALDPLRDGSNPPIDVETGDRLYEERDFTEFNSSYKDTYFYEVYQRVPFRVGRVRIVVLPPLGVYEMHVDSGKRLHVPIKTNPNAYILFGEGVLFRLPANGALYELDTTRPHTAVNASREPRVHLTMTVVGDK